MSRSLVAQCVVVVLGLVVGSTAFAGNPPAALGGESASAGTTCPTLDPPPPPPPGYRYLGTAWHEGVLCWIYTNDMGDYLYIPVTSP